MDASQVTPAQIAALRGMISEPDDSNGYTDASLAQNIADANAVIGAAAYYIWSNKAASFASLVDITEGASSRKNSQSFTNAKSMADHFQAYVPNDPVNEGGRRSRTRAIVRP